MGKKMVSEKELLTVSDIANITGFSSAYVRQLARSGKIPAVKIGYRRWFFPTQKFSEWINAGNEECYGESADVRARSN